MKYVLLIIVIMSCQHSICYCQILYTDINPDSSFSAISSTGNTPVSASMTVDLNQDGIPDFDFIINSYDHPAFHYQVTDASVIASDSNNTIAMLNTTVSSCTCILKTLDSGTFIDSNFVWQTTAYLTSNPFLGTCVCTIPTGIDKYIPIKMIINNQTHFGWIRILFTCCNQITVKDMALNLTPNLGLFAGSTVTSVQEIQFENNEMRIFPNPIKSGFFLEAPDFQNSALKIWDLAGNLIFEECFNSTSYINLNEAPPGIYLIEIVKKQDIIARSKIVKLF